MPDKRAGESKAGYESPMFKTYPSYVTLRSKACHRSVKFRI